MDRSETSMAAPTQPYSPVSGQGEVETPAIPEALVRYFAARQDQEARRVEDVLAAMNPRERKLVREVAVMANVRAMRRYGYSRMEPPPDSEVLYDAISACLHMSDLYPAMARMERTGFRRRKTVVVVSRG